MYIVPGHCRKRHPALADSGHLHQWSMLAPAGAAVFPSVSLITGPFSTVSTESPQLHLVLAFSPHGASCILFVLFCKASSGLPALSATYIYPLNDIQEASICSPVPPRNCGELRVTALGPVVWKQHTPVSLLLLLYWTSASLISSQPSKHTFFCSQIHNL